MRKLFYPFLALFLVQFSACKTSTSESAAQGSNEAKVVHLAIWSNFVTDDILQEFTKQTGIQVETANYSSNEELLAKMQAGASGYDVIVPCDYLVLVMSNLGLLSEIDHAKIPNLKSIDAKYMKMYFDPENKFSLPFDWGTTGIAVNRKLFKGKIQGWKDVFDNKALEGKYTLLDDARETLGAALKKDGFSLNSVNGGELGKAKQTLLGAKNHVKGFTSETLMGLVNGEMVVAHAYSSDALQAAAKTNGAIEFVIPSEGATYWVDNVAIPKEAPHKEAAHALINFLLSPQVQAARASKLYVAPVSKEAVALLTPNVRSNRALFPDQKTLSKTEMIKDLGAQLTQWDRIWTEAKAAQ
ncbi:MAG: spermidine/putrescine ABC transporter substrate-binding protein [Deltaproteobacteria bacterium]|nr:spermidine/putrescine ABC transporter substrate-binding protein [Deltaproteobacteria bacterium]